jgi:hypothetical protein
MKKEELSEEVRAFRDLVKWCKKYGATIGARSGPVSVVIKDKVYEARWYIGTDTHAVHLITETQLVFKDEVPMFKVRPHGVMYGKS